MAPAQGPLAKQPLDLILEACTRSAANCLPDCVQQKETEQQLSLRDQGRQSHQQAEIQPHPLGWEESNSDLLVGPGTANTPRNLGRPDLGHPLSRVYVETT